MSAERFYFPTSSVNWNRINYGINVHRIKRISRRSVVGLMDSIQQIHLSESHFFPDRRETLDIWMINGICVELRGLHQKGQTDKKKPADTVVDLGVFLRVHPH